MSVSLSLKTFFNDFISLFSLSFPHHLSARRRCGEKKVPYIDSTFSTIYNRDLQTMNS